MTRQPICEFLVASCVKDGGVYRYRLYENGAVELLSKISMPSPMFLSLDGDRLWTVLRAPFKDSDESALYAVNAHTGEALTEITSTKGTVACHVAADGNDAYCANYLSGSVFKTGGALAIHEGHGCDEKRQASPHVHSTVFSPDKKYLISCDLGLDTVFVYDRELRPLSRARVPDGAGVRHAVFSKDEKYLYAVNEMGGSVSVFSWDAPHLSYLHTVSVLPSGFGGIGSGAAIKISQSGEYLYVTERATGNIVTLKADGDRVSVLSFTDCMGKEPRDFTLLSGDRFAVCANQFSDNLSIFKIGSDNAPSYLSDVKLPSPLCVLEIKAL